MVLKSIELLGFKSFAKKTTLVFDSPVTGIVGPNGSGKSNVVEAIRFVLGEQSMKSLRGKGGTDLIFKGSKQLPQMNRASVTIVFDNTKRIFSFGDSSDTKIKDMSFNEVRLTREVYADGANKYLINNTEVRLKDIVELLASVHIGSSGHHIISQGEADRILSANSKDRRIMIEDALGLKLYQYRIKESERRLEKTEINMKEVSALRRELAPHILYLKKQVEKIEKTQTLREELISYYKIYGTQEKYVLDFQKKDILTRKDVLMEEFNKINTVVQEEEQNKTIPFISKYQKSYEAVLSELQKIEQTKQEYGRSLGRLEGAKDALEKPRKENEEKKEKFLPVSFLKSTLLDIKKDIDHITILEDFSSIHSLATQTVSRINKTLFEIEEENTLHVHIERDTKGEIEAISNEIRSLEKDIQMLNETHRMKVMAKDNIEADMRLEQDERRNNDRGFYEALSQKGIIESRIREINRDFDDLRLREENFHQELTEGVALLGTEMPKDFNENIEGDIASFLLKQTDLKKKIERVKIKIEESGALGGSETLKEYEETLTRDQFLSKELADLSTSIANLRELIADLKVRLDQDFKEGIEKINTVFEKFFSLMFGGGSAHLSISVEHKRKKKDDDEDVIDSTEDDMEFERGIDINVSLPQKKVKELSMLSGGERSLTSIALLFAMSQVNPPPFLVLDETDAALDEANSRRYGDMIENLSHVSQLAVVTHNRETMSRAGILYGVTVGMDGGSKLLSIKFDDAAAYAK